MNQQQTPRDSQPLIRGDNKRGEYNNKLDSEYKAALIVANNDRQGEVLPLVIMTPCLI